MLAGAVTMLKQSTIRPQSMRRTLGWAALAALCWSAARAYGSGAAQSLGEEPAPRPAAGEVVGAEEARPAGSADTGRRSALWQTVDSEFRREKTASSPSWHLTEDGRAQLREQIRRTSEAPAAGAVDAAPHSVWRRR